MKKDYRIRVNVDLNLRVSGHMYDRLLDMSADERADWAAGNCFRNNARYIHTCDFELITEIDDE